MISMAAVGIIGALISAGTAVFNAVSQSETNKRNIQAQEDINTENKDYAAAQTQAAWERDDTAMQRAVADAEAAGLSPLAVHGGAATTSPMSYSGQAAMVSAPQLDGTAMQQGLMQVAQLQEQKREFDIQHSEHMSQQEIEREGISNNLSVAMATLKQNRELADSSAAQSAYQFAQQQKLTMDMHRDDMSERSAQRVQQRNIELAKELGCPNNCIDRYDDWDEYVKARDAFNSAYAEYVATISPDSWSQSDSSTQSDSHSSNTSGNLSLSPGKGAVGKAIGSVVGSASAGASHGSSSSTSTGESTGRSESNQTAVNAQMRAFFMTHHYPVFD